jgi:hypothetical protein
MSLFVAYTGQRHRGVFLLKAYLFCFAASESRPSTSETSGFRNESLIIGDVADGTAVAMRLSETKRPRQSRRGL